MNEPYAHRRSGAKVATTLLEGFANRLWGVKPGLMAHFVDQHGSAPALAWFVRHMPRYERILKRWGPLRTHLLSSAVSTLNGCAYCTFGHAHAFQLHYLQKYDRLFPLDENAMTALHDQGETQTIVSLSAALRKADLESEIPLLLRLQSLRSDPGARSLAARARDDADLKHLIKMFAALNACGIKGQVEPDAAHDPINRDGELKQRYLWLRRNQTDDRLQTPEAVPSTT